MLPSDLREPNAISRFAVQRRVAVTMIAAAIVVLGCFALPRLPISLLPSFSPPVINVSVSYPNVSPEAMETLVTRPIENAVSRVAGIENMSSTSSEGSTSVRAEFHYGVNIDTAAVDVQEQVDRSRGQLPNDPSLQAPQIQKSDPNSLPVIRAFVTDPDFSQRDLSDLFTNQLNDEFSAVQGVGSVSSSASQSRAIMIEPDQAALAGSGITSAQIIARLQSENVNIAAGIAQIARNEFQIRTNALYTSAEQIANTVVTTKNGAPVSLRDVAKVSDSIQEQRTFSRLNGQAALSFTINAQPDANVVGVADGVYAKMEVIKKRYPGMTFGVALDQRGFILDAIGALERTAAYGAILAIFVILMFLHSWRSTLIVTLSLPISVLGTLFAAYLLHYSLNTLTLGGLALAVGLIVDDAIVVIENIYRHLACGESTIEATQNGVTEIFSAVVASSVTVITVFIPLVLIPGLQGLLFTPFAVMVMVAIGLSLVVAVTTVPMLATILFRPALPQRNQIATPAKPRLYDRFSAAFDRGYEQIEQQYRRFLSVALDHPGPVFALAAGIFLITILVLRSGVVSTELFPATDSRFVRLTLRMPTGTALAITDAVAHDVEQRIARDPHVATVGDTVGSGGYGGGAGSALTNQATLQVSLKEGTSSAEAGRFVQIWQTGLGGAALRSSRSRAPVNPRTASYRAYRKIIGAPIPGLTVFGRTIDIVAQVISQGQDELQIQIFGPNIAKLASLAQTAIVRLAAIPGVTRPDTNVTAAQPQLNILIDRQRAASLGLSTATIAQVVDTATSGTIASYLQVNGTQYPMYVQAPAAQRRSYEALANLAIPVSATSGSGSSSSLLNTVMAAPGQGFTFSTVPLGSIAAITVGSGPSQISRQDKQREIDINASLVGTALGDAVRASSTVMSELTLPAGYHWQFGPAIAQQGSTFGSLGLIVVLAIALVYMLLAAQFESFLHPLVIITAVPLSLAGVVAALIISHRSFGLTAFIGSLMLVGIVVKNAILVVEFTNQLRQEGADARTALVQAAPLRLRPILMTTLATIGGMIPLALGLEAGSASQAPLGTVVIGGLLCSTLLSLIVVPTLYLWSSRIFERALK